MGFSSLLKKSTGMDYLQGETNSSDQKPREASKKSESSNGLSKQDEKMLKNLEQNLKRINNMIEDMLEKVRVRRGL